MQKDSPKADDQEYHDDDKADDPGLGENFRIVLHVFRRRRRRDDLLRAADGAHEDAVAQLCAAGRTNHGIISYFYISLLL